MGGYYDEIEIEDMTWDPVARVFHYPCPCGDRFEISRAQLAECEDIATCPSCSLIIRVIFDPLDYEDYEEEEDEDEASSAEESEPKEEDDADLKQSRDVAALSTDAQLTDAVNKLQLGDNVSSSTAAEKDGAVPEVEKDPIDARDPGVNSGAGGTKATSPPSDADIAPKTSEARGSGALGWLWGASKA